MASQRIMLIDNEIGLCRMMEAVLKDQGYQVKSFTRPVQAVAEFSAGDYDLIINFCLLKGVQFMKTGHSHAVPIHLNMQWQEPVMKINAKSATSSPTTPTASAIKNLVNGQPGSGLKTRKYNYIVT